MIKPLRKQKKKKMIQNYFALEILCVCVSHTLSQHYPYELLVSQNDEGGQSEASEVYMLLVSLHAVDLAHCRCKVLEIPSSID